MAEHMWDLRGVTPSTVRVAVVHDRQRRQVYVCDYLCLEATRHRRQVSRFESPLESLFRGGRFDKYFTRPISANHSSIAQAREAEAAVGAPGGADLESAPATSADGLREGAPAEDPVQVTQ